MNIQALQAQRELHVHQRITMMVNRYEVFADDGNGSPGQLLAFVEQKRLAFKEHVTIYSNESRQQTVAGFRARNVIDLASGYDVFDGEGRSIGLFAKKFGKSLLRSTWTLNQHGLPELTGQERSMPLALFRRIWGAIPFVGDAPFPIKYHFDFRQGDQLAFTMDKITRFRDHYRVSIHDPALDRRLVLAQAIALDALQSR